MKNTKKLLKRILTLIMCIGLALSFSACEIPFKLEKVMDIDDYEKDTSEWQDIRDGFSEAKTDKEEKTSEEEKEQTSEEGNIIKFLLIGVDSRDGDFSGRSDTIILVTINKDTKKVLLTSILRDIYADIPGYNSNRINAATVYGGSELLKKTIDANFGIEVQDSITFNFNSVREIVDYLGGIDMELTSEEIEIMNGYLVSQNDNFGNAPGTDIMEVKDGTCHLNGNQTLAYCRIRYVGTDFMRTERQRTVIKKCIEKIKNFDAADLAMLAAVLYKNVESNISLTDAIELLTMVINLSEYETNTFTIPMDGTWNNAEIDNMAVLDIDFEANSSEWRRRVEQ